jgi:intracellular septation protein A
MNSWSIYWRLFLLCVAMGLVVGVVIDAAYFGNLNPTAVRWKPTLVWWIDAVCLWVVTSAAPRFLETLLFAKKLQFSPQMWLQIGRYTCLLLVVAGVASLLVSELFASAWPTFKNLALPVGLLIVSVFATRTSKYAIAKIS